MRYNFYILLILAFSACETEIQVDQSEYKPFVVVNSIVSADSMWVVQLNYSKSIFDNSDFKPVEDASVHIAVMADTDSNVDEEIQSFYLQHEGNGRYTRSNRPAEGRNYQLTVEVDEEVITARTYVPKVLHASAEVIELTPDSKHISIEVIEDEARENFYAYELLPIVEDKTELDQTEALGGGDSDTNNDAASSTEEANFTQQFGKFNGFKGAVPAQSDQSGSIIVDLDNITIRSDQSSTSTLPGGDTSSSSNASNKYTLKVWAVSIDYYNYLISVQESSLPDSEKTFYNYHTNITNGGGIFAGYNLEEILIEF